MYPVYPYLGYEKKVSRQPLSFPPQHQPWQPGLEYLMSPPPICENPHYRGSGKLLDRVAVVTGGDSGIGRATAIAFAKEGAHVVIPYLYEEKDAEATRMRVEELGRRCLPIPCDLKEKTAATEVIQQTLSTFGKLNILVNNHAVQFRRKSILEISPEQLELTFRTNIFSFFYLTQAALPHLPRGSSIINTTSVTAYEGEPKLIDYSSTKGAIVSFTRSLSQSLIHQGIRVNAVAPGPIWTPLIPSSFSAEEVARFGTDTPMKRAGQPFELAPTYVYLASDDSGYVSGQVLHVNGGVITET